MNNLFSGMLGNTRTVKGRLSVYDERLLFGDVTASHQTLVGVNFDMSTFTVSTAGTYIYTFVRADNWHIYYTRRTDPDEIPAWVDSGIITYPGSPLAAFDDTMFYYNAAGTLVKRTYPFNSDVGIAQPDLSFGTFSGTIASTQLSAISETDVYCLIKYTFTNGRSVSKLVHVQPAGLTEWTGRIYDLDDQKSPFSAIRYNNTNYIYVSDSTQFRTYWMKEENLYLYSEMKQVVPLDILDDLTIFYMTSASVINDKVVVTGRLKRPDSDTQLLVYLMGPEEFSFGRDMFISVPPATDNFYDFGGKLFAIGTQVIYQSFDYKYIAPGSTLFGNMTEVYDDGVSFPIIAQRVEKGINISLNKSLGSPGSGSVDISPNAIAAGLPALRPGTVVRPEIHINDGTINQWMPMGEFEIDGAIDPFEGSERSITLSVRQKAIRRLSQWTCDAPYDYWSQTKLSCNPKDLTDVIRVAGGHWDDDGEDLKFTELNEDNYFYANAKAGRNTEVEAIFNLYELTNTDVRVGVCVNFFSETRAQAATAMSKSPSTIVESDLKKYSVMFWYDPKIDRAGVTFIGSKTNREIYSRDIYVNPGERCLLRATFTDGDLMCYLIPAFNYSTPVDYINSVIYKGSIQEEHNLPWARAEIKEGDELGRGAVYMRASTQYTYVYPFASTDTYIPLKTTPFTTTSGTVKVGSEIMTYANKTAKTAITSPLEFAIGIELASMDGSIDTNQIFADQRSRNYIRQEFIIPDAKYVVDSTYCTGISIKAKKNFFPQDGLNLMLYDRSITADRPLGNRKASKIIVSENISEEYDWITAIFNVPVAVSKTTDHIICCRGEDANHPNSQAFYTAGLVSGNPYTSGRFFTFSDQLDTFTEISNKDVPFKIYGTYDPPGGNYVVRVKRVAALSVTTDYYKNMALYVSDGAGKGSTYLITGYLYGAEVCTFYLARNPSAFNTTSRFMVVNTLYGAVRSAPMAHRLDEKVDKYYAGPYAGCERLNYFTTDRDKTLADMANIICKKAGVLKFSERYLVDGYVDQFTNPILNEDLKNVIMNITIPSSMLNEARLTFRNGAVSVGFENNGTSVYINVYFDGVYNCRFHASRASDKPILLSLNDNFLSFWSLGRYIASIPTPETDTVEPGITLGGTALTPVYVQISELSYRVDNFLLDIGTTGLQLLDRLINNKIYYYLDDGVGGIKMFRGRTDVNTELTPYTLAVAAGRTDTDASVFSRIRVEGAKAKETLDLNLMREYGNIYRTVNIDEIYNMDDAEYFSKALVDDARDKTEIVSLIGSADPRIEPHDVIYSRILKRDGTNEVKRVIVDDITFTLSGDENVEFDMNINGRIDK